MTQREERVRNPVATLVKARPKEVGQTLTPAALCPGLHPVGS